LPIDPNDPDASAPTESVISGCVHHFEGGWSEAIGI
jgi:hypothetical protein